MEITGLYLGAGCSSRVGYDLPAAHIEQRVYTQRLPLRLVLDAAIECGVDHVGPVIDRGSPAMEGCISRAGEERIYALLTIAS